jgi:uncharacterized RDD family membrane protein YckC
MTDSELQTKRLIAAAIDIAISIAIGFGVWIVSFGATFALGQASDSAIAMYVPRVLGFGGAALQLGYVLGRDLLGGGCSLGKKFQGIRVVTLSGGEISFMDSVKRNAIFAIGSSLGMLASTLQLIPCVGDAVVCILTPLMALGVLISLVCVVIEMVKITSDPEGIRMGDAFAGTRVVR